MGADIHMVVQVRKDGDWVDFDGMMECESCCGTGECDWRKNKICWRCEGSKLEPLRYRNRNYDAFAILADVRNGHGFAGCDTGDGFVPISEPRGLPDDFERISEEYSNDGEKVRGHDLGEHSFSWLTLKELLDFDFEQTTIKHGIVGLPVFKKWKESEETWPESWCGGVSGEGVDIVDEERAELMIAAGAIPEPEQKGPFSGTYVRTSWPATYRECAKDLIEFIDKLKGIGGPDDTRIVFGFDS
jgi:hypothetical protein